MELPKKTTLVCLTNSYPYGTRETYFETELQYLAEKFDEVIILPKYNPYDVNVKRTIPSNVVVWRPIVPRNKVFRFIVGILNVSPFGFYVTELLDRKLYKNFRYLKGWFKSLLMYRRIYSQTKGLFSKLDPKYSVVYSYWAEAPLFLTEKLSYLNKAVRMHRGDFYEDERGGYLPLRKQIYEKAQFLVPISQQIADILAQDYEIDPGKISVNYLGVIGGTPDPVLKSNPDKLVIASCSRVDPIKRVDLIAEAVIDIGKEYQISWHHFGDGTEFDSLKQKVEDIADGVEIFFHGWAEQADLLEFYAKENVVWFVNVSLHEGVPVSIMEAMAHGIPCIATDVGATSELVNNNNGILVSKEISGLQLREHILSYKNESYSKKREAAYNHWRENFNAEKNYRKLCQELKGLI